MNINLERCSRYLVKLKHITDYISKCEHKDREIMENLSEINYNLYHIEELFRKLSKKLGA